MTAQAALHDAPSITRGNDIEKLEATLGAVMNEFTRWDIFQRDGVREVGDIINPHGEFAARPLHTIFWYPLVYIGFSKQVIVYRVDGENHKAIKLGLLDDTKNAYQTVTIDELIAFLQDPPVRLQTSIEDVHVRAEEARLRVHATGHYGS